MSHPTTVRFEDGEYRRLQQVAERRGVSVSELVREAVRVHYLEESRDEAAESLVEYIRTHSDPRAEEGGDSPAAIDEAIDEAMSDAAG